MTAKERKERPVYSGVLRYFPDALLEVARCSFIGNEQHNPGEPLRWDRAKSTDEADALVRHLMAAGTLDTDGIPHTAKVAWRALALLQKEIEANRDSRTSNVHEIVNTAPPVNLTYDDRRTGQPPCACGRWFTHPEKCEMTGKCLALKHPHARCAEAASTHGR